MLPVLLSCTSLWWSLRSFCVILYWLCRSGLPSGTVGGNKTDASSQQSSGNGTRSTVKADNDNNPNERREQRSSGLEKDRNIPKGNKYTYIPSLSTAVPFLISIISLLEVNPSWCFIWTWNLVGWLSMKHVYLLLDFTKLLISLLGAIKIYCPNQVTLPPVCQINNWITLLFTSLLPTSPWPATLYLLPACPFLPLFPTSWHFPLRLKERIHDGDGDGAGKKGIGMKWSFHPLWLILTEWPDWYKIKLSGDGIQFSDLRPWMEKLLKYNMPRI